MSRKEQRFRDDDTNPCILETDASRKCMDDNNYNKDMCTVHFERYKNCRKFWYIPTSYINQICRLDSAWWDCGAMSWFSHNRIMIQRRSDGMKPAMPPAEERKKILESIQRIPY